MLSKLQTRNYLRAKKHNIELDPHITCLVGKSAIGKSSLLRSLRWLALNKPTGSGFINWDADKTIVQLTVDKHKVVRKKGKTENLYKLDKYKFKSFKNNVPVPIDKLLNLNDVNFQTQFAPHFWFSLSPPEVGRQLNQIVNLDSIDTALSKIASKTRKVKTHISVIHSRMYQYKENVKKNSFIIAVDTALTAIKDQQKVISRTTAEASVLNTLISNAISHRTLYNNEILRVSDAKNVVHYGSGILTCQIGAENLQNTILKIKRLQKVLHSPIPNIDNIKRLKQMVESLQSQKQNLSALFIRAEQQEEILCQEKEVAKNLRKRLTVLTKYQCPLCGQKMS